MSILSQEITRRSAAHSKGLSETSSESEAPSNRFRALMEISEIDERVRQREKEEEEEEKIDSSPLDLLCSPPAQTFLKSDEKEKKEGIALDLPPSRILAGAELFSVKTQMLLSAEIDVLFEKMASLMLITHSSGETETTLFLDNPTSLFCGTRITVREFSTAPKAFNVEIASSPAAIAAIEAGKNDLMAAFQNGKFPFSIHRFDTQLQDVEERPLFHRKEPSQNEQGGDPL